MSRRTLLFSDLDGCLLNKSDYSFAAAVPVLHRIAEAEIPLILASSKTEAEMRVIADEMQLRDAPLICENGGAIFWSRLGNSDDKTVMGTHRDDILALLKNLKARYQFESFADLGLDGVMRATDLPEAKAQLALQRSSTEPMLWHDSDEKIAEFRNEIEDASLSLTKGGRFWHIAGLTDKGLAMQEVTRQFASAGARPLTIAVGDSPIDQGMLDVADFPIGIPSPDGLVHVTVNGNNGRISETDGASGWAESVAQVLDELGY